MSNGRVRVGMLGAGFIILMHLLEVRNHHVGQDAQRAAEPIQPRPASGVSRLSLGRWGKIHGFDAVPSAVAAGNLRRWLPRIRLARLYRCSHRLSPDRLAGQLRLDTRATFPPLGWTEPSTPAGARRSTSKTRRGEQYTRWKAIACGPTAMPGKAAITRDQVAELTEPYGDALLKGALAMPRHS